MKIYIIEQTSHCEWRDYEVTTAGIFRNEDEAIAKMKELEEKITPSMARYELEYNIETYDI